MASLILVIFWIVIHRLIYRLILAVKLLCNKLRPSTCACTDLLSFALASSAMVGKKSM